VKQTGIFATADPSASKPMPEPPRTLTGEAYRRIEEMIVTLELAPGAVVSEAILSERVGIGTTPIREALQRLAREYLVQILPRRGVVVTGIDVRQQLQVLETRRELDRLIARSAARRSTPAERQRIAELADAMAEHVRAGDVRGFLRLDGDLNAVAARAARNEIAANTVATLHSVSRRFWFYHHQDNHRAAQTMTLHVALARAIASGDDAAAGVASDTLTDQLFEFARSTLIAA